MINYGSRTQREYMLMYIHLIFMDYDASLLHAAFASHNCSILSPEYSTITLDGNESQTTVTVTIIFEYSIIWLAFLLVLTLNRKSIVQAIIMSRLDYCNGLLYGMPAVHLGKLQRLQNATAWLVCTVSSYDHITSSLISLHWLPVTHRIEFKIHVAMLVHKCIYGVAPQYLSDLTIKVSSWYQLRSYQSILLMDNTKRTKKTLADRAFGNVAPKVWNRLPLEIRQCQSLNTFKVLLKTHLFKLAFYQFFF